MILFHPLLNQEDQNHRIPKMIKEAKLQEWNQCSSDASIANRISRPLQSLDLHPHLKMKHQNEQMLRMVKFEGGASVHCHGVYPHLLPCEKGIKTFHQGCRLERGGTSQWRKGEGEAHHHHQGVGELHLLLLLEGADHLPH